MAQQIVYLDTRTMALTSAEPDLSGRIVEEVTTQEGSSAIPLIGALQGYIQASKIVPDEQKAIVRVKIGA